MRPRRTTLFLVVFSLLFVLITQTASAATHDWTFVKGSNDYLNEFGVYADPTPANNHPGSRYRPVTWTDTAGDLWLFGGYGYGASGLEGHLNDLWKFDPTTGIWTFVKGSGDYRNESGVYDNPNPANNLPGSRNGAVGWTDAAGDLWLFGGNGYGETLSGYLNDLWKFDPDTGNWTFVKGSDDYVQEPGEYDDPDPANNYPGSRIDAVTWIDASGKLWLFGGNSLAGLSQSWNDLWKFDPNTGNWTFIKGAGDNLAEFGVYNDADPADNHPGSRYRASAWIDAAGKLWLFGGHGYAASGSDSDLNDLWKFDPTTGNWTFIKGSGDYQDEFGVYADPTPANNLPGSREGSVSWTDVSGNLWLFGGDGLAASGFGDYLNDLWKFNPATGNWTFVKGSGDYRDEFGMYADPAPANNYPGSRGVAAAWTDKSNRLWLFGGLGYAASGSHDTLNDLWKFELPPIFADVPVAGSEWMRPWIETFYIAKITTGCGAGPLIYCPDRSVTRAEMAVFILRAMHYPGLPYTPTDPDDHFADVPVTGKEWMRPWIEEFYDLGISTGCAANPLRFCPERAVTRAEMAVFILRALEGSSYTPPAASDYFSDVPVATKEWMEPWIDEFYRRGITTGCAAAPLRYCPEREVTRAELAVFILRAFSNLPKP